MVNLIDLVYDLFIKNLDHTLVSISITILFFFYGFSIIKDIIKDTEGTRFEKFTLFVILVIFGINLILANLVNLILSIIDVNLKWIIIIFLVILVFYKFDKEILRK